MHDWRVHNTNLPFLMKEPDEEMTAWIKEQRGKTELIFSEIRKCDN